MIQPRFQILAQTGHRRWVGPAVLLQHLDCRLPTRFQGRGVAERQHVRFHFRPRAVGHFVQHVAHRMHPAADAEALRPDLGDRPELARDAIAGDRHRRPEPAGHQMAEELQPTLVALLLPQREVQQDFPAVAQDPPGPQDRLLDAPCWRSVS